MNYIIYIVIFTILQALFFGNVQLFGVAVPLFYVYIVLMLQRDMKRWMQLLLPFVMGMMVDIFENTPGLAMTAMTTVGFLQHYMLEMLLDREDAMDMRPSISTMGFWRYFLYSFTLTLIYCCIYFLLEAFSFNDWLTMLKTIGASLAITMIFVLVIDALRKK